ncbi:MAG TPA: sigma-70 family RNA polymerase sigma factor [Thermoguttaceae bacterium]|nr:sigma-70 family RNA polymerase sigma factor [Thermoguttaceae bacterium]
MQRLDEAYLQDIRSIAPLTVDEERELSDRLAAGEDTAARNRLAEGGLRLAAQIALRLLRGWPGFDLDGAVGAGSVALIGAAGRFDVRKGCRFTTYASKWVEPAIQREMHRRMLPAISLDSPDADEAFNDSEPRPGKAYADRDLVDVLLAQLDDDEQTIVILMFGIDSDEGGLSYAAIGRRLHLSREAVRLIAAAALDRLRRLAVQQDGRHVYHPIPAPAAARPATETLAAVSA